MTAKNPLLNIGDSSHWYKWLWETMSVWTHLATASASQAQMAQSLSRDGRNPARPFAPDIKAQRLRLGKLIAGDPDQLERHWDEIQRLLFLELKSGDYGLARNLAGKMATAISTRGKLLHAIATQDNAAFEQAWSGSPSESASHYSDEEDRHLVRFWTFTEGRGLPPFCCWTDSALGCYFAARRNIQSSLSEHHFENRREALGLIKLPILIVDGWRDEQPVFHAPPAQIAPDRLKAFCSKITIDIFEAAYPIPQMAASPSLLLLTLDKNLNCLSAEVREALRRML